MYNVYMVTLDVVIIVLILDMEGTQSDPRLENGILLYCRYSFIYQLIIFISQQ